MGKLDIVMQLSHSQCVSFGGKIINFLSSGFCNFFPKLCQFRDFRNFFKV